MKSTLLKAIIFLLILVPNLSMAADRFSVIESRPAPYGNFYSVIDSQTLLPLDWQVGTTLSYGTKYLMATNLDVVKYLFVQHLHGTLGITNEMDLSVDMPVIWRNRFTTPVAGSQASNQMSLGDLQLLARYHFFGNPHSSFRLSVSPFLTIPTGKENEFVGDDGVTGGLYLVADGDVGSRFGWGVNFGSIFRKQYSAFNLNFDEQFSANVAASVKVNDHISILSEFETRTPFNDFFDHEDTTYLTVKTGLRLRLGTRNQVLFKMLGAYGLLYGTGNPHYGVHLDVSFISLRKMKDQMVYFDFDRTAIKESEKKKLNKLGKLLATEGRVDEVLISGSADQVGSKRYNLKLSQLRAETIKKYLQDRFHFDGTITTIGKGEAKRKQNVLDRNVLIECE